LRLKQQQQNAIIISQVYFSSNVFVKDWSNIIETETVTDDR